MNGELNRHKCERKRWLMLQKLYNLQGIWFHLVGIACIIWFLVRVLPKPDRLRYPCQQMSITVAMGYIAFWTVLFHGLGLWIKRVKLKTAVIAPAILAVLIFLFIVTEPVFSNNISYLVGATERWDPIPKEPIGTPKGYNPGRVAWGWNPNATEKDLTGYWWKKENNDQAIIDQMFSLGIKTLACVTDEYSAWDLLFKYFNEEHGHGEVGYQSGEKIAIKINLNNCWSYTEEDNDRDASPYVVKALLRQLVNTVNVAQEDITVYDASRRMGNWFYNRVYYEEYPANPLVPEFPDVHYVDSVGGASGREKVVASTERVYFAAGSCAYRTLPTCVAEADYLINMPILKRHPIKTGVTLAGKNFFGTWMESVADIHPYHEFSFTLGNPAPQTDLFAHEHIGGKVVLYIGDGIFATPWDHRVIGKFQMYPFNDDWTNSLYFSQDPVAIDSVMYDFLHAEGTNPCEGSQNYLHQSAEPPEGVYDPENDGVYLTDSLGVHEHWDTTEDIFSSERYSGPSNNGIDYIACGKEELEADAYGPYYGLINEPVQFSGSAEGGTPPYTWHWDFGDGNSSTGVSPMHTYTVIGNYTVTLTVTDDYGLTDTAVAYVIITSKPNNPPVNPPNGHLNNNAPMADANGPYTGFVNVLIPFDGSKSNDPDGNITLYEWDFGDGNSSTGVSPMHTYTVIGNYTVTLTVTDDYGLTDTAIAYVIITSKPNNPPSKPLLHGYIKGNKNADYNYTASSTDSDNDSIRYIFNWSDGTETTTDFVPNGTGFTAMHNWTTTGIYTVKVYAEDEHNARSETAELTVLIDAYYCNNIGYFIDNNSDGIFDLFYCNKTGKNTVVEIQDDGKYKIDINGDGSWDHTYDPAAGTLTSLKEETGLTKETEIPWFMIIGIIMALSIITVIVYVYKKEYL